MNNLKRKTREYSDEIHTLYPDRPFDGQTISVTFQVTDACNLCCTYCYQTHKGKHSMPFEVAKEFIELILEKDSNRNNYFNSWESTALIMEFIGGEPFLEIDLIDKITDYFVKRLIELDHPWQYHYMVSICSNGVLYFDDRVQHYMRKNRDHLSFNISVDGNKELHDACRVFSDGSGSYDLAIAGVKHYNEHFGREMGSKMTIAPQNVALISNAVISMINNGYKEINLNCVFEEGWNEHYATILYEQLKELSDYVLDNDLEDELEISIFSQNSFRPLSEDNTNTWCGGGAKGSMIAVDYKGDIYPCLRYMESSIGENQPAFIIGNTKEGILTKSCWCERRDCLACTTRQSESPKECLECPIAEGCAECMAYNYQLYGLPMKRATFICIMHKARSLANAYFWNKMYIKHGTNDRFKIWLPDEDALTIISKDELEMLHSLEHTVISRE